MVAQKRHTRKVEMAMPAHMKSIALFLERRGIPSEDCQSFTIGPKNLWLSNQAWNRSDDFEKHQAASKTSGVVGNRGKKIPITPVIKESHPKIKSKIRFPFISTSPYDKNETYILLSLVLV